MPLPFLFYVLVVGWKLVNYRSQRHTALRVIAYRKFRLSRLIQPQCCQDREVQDAISSPHLKCQVRDGLFQRVLLKTAVVAIRMALI